MSVLVGSIFRNSVEYIDRYFDQVAKLDAALGEPVRLILAEGDSTDDTYQVLHDRLVDLPGEHQLIKAAHGDERIYGSVDHIQRWANIAFVCNRLMERAVIDGPMIYVESDLIWEPETMVRLLEDLAVYPAVAPMSMKGDHFYDVWGHRGLDGERFASDPPFHPSLASESPLIHIASAGSCIVMREDLARVVRFGENDCIVGLGRDINHRASLWLDRRVSVTHP